MDSENIRYTYGVDPRTDYNDGTPPADMQDPVWIEGRWYERTEPWPGESPDAQGSLF